MCPGSNPEKPETSETEQRADQAINEDQDRGPSRTGRREPSNLQQENDDESAKLDNRKP